MFFLNPVTRGYSGYKKQHGKPDRLKNHITNQRAAFMSKNPRKFREPVRLIVSVEAVTVNAIDDLMKAGSNRGHHNRSEFVRLAIERELRRCQSD